MNDLRLLELAPQVVAWHNRHLLARRIGLQHVNSMGYVALPFIDPAAGGAAATAADGAAALSPDGASSVAADLRAQGQPAAVDTQPEPPPLPPTRPGALRRAFSEDFMAPLSPARVARWAAQCGVPLSGLPPDAPVRRIAADADAAAHADAAGAALTERWVMTAQIDDGRGRSRVLIGAGAAPGVLGPRLISTARAGGLTAVAFIAAALVAVWALGSGDVGAGADVARGPAAASVAASAASAASVASVASTASTASTASAALVAPEASAASISASAPAATASVPAVVAPDAQPTLGRVELPSITPHIDARRRAAVLAASAASATTASSSDTAPAPRRPPSPAPAIAAAPAAPTTPAVPRPAAPAPAVGVPTGTAFAVSTRPLRTRAESEQIAAAMRALLPAASTLPLTVEVLAVGDDWRVVGWPYAGRDAAERARALLATRGIRVQVVDF